MSKRIMYEVVYMDYSLCDVSVVAHVRDTNEPGKIPVLIATIDKRSRTIIACQVVANVGSDTGATANAADHKVEPCALHGPSITDNEWPTNYSPLEILADRGKLSTEYSEMLAHKLGAVIVHRPTYHGDWKDIAERQFRTANVIMKERLRNHITRQTRCYRYMRTDRRVKTRSSMRRHNE